MNYFPLPKGNSFQSIDTQSWELNVSELNYYKMTLKVGKDFFFFFLLLIFWVILVYRQMYFQQLEQPEINT